jgi:hypothetical protein
MPACLHCYAPYRLGLLSQHLAWGTDDRRRARDGQMTHLPSSGRIRSYFGAAAATVFAFSGLFFVAVHDQEIGFGAMAFGLCFLSFALTFRWPPAVERLRRPPK